MTAVTYASAEASVMATTLTQPIWVVRTRMLLNTQPRIRGLEHAVAKTKEIYEQCGPRGFLKGFGMSLVLSSSVVLQMYLYEGSKLLYSSFKIPESKFSESHFICGSLSKLVTVLVAYPLTTIRTRIQQNQFFNNRTEAKYHNVREITMHLVQDEGVRGFYKGILPNLLKDIPQRGIYFYVYELMKSSWVKVGDKEKGA
jgi:solute carrier family 25 folate transporter 32